MTISNTWMVIDSKAKVISKIRAKLAHLINLSTCIVYHKICQFGESVNQPMRFEKAAGCPSSPLSILFALVQGGEGDEVASSTIPHADTLG